VLRDAEVIASGKTDASGRWEVKLPPGSYTVIVVAPGYAESRQSVEIAAGETTPLEVTLELLGGLAVLVTARRV